jgi:hypothetical protein
MTLEGRLVRQDGSSSDVAVSCYSRNGCIASGELMVGEIVSVEFTDVALFVGQVTSSGGGKSQVNFFGLPGYAMQ